MHEPRKTVIRVSMDDGTHSRITLFTRDSTEDAPVVLCMPAMGVPAEYYEPLAIAGASHGWHMITADLRGIGYSSVRASRKTQFGYHEMVTYDWPAIVSAARKRFPSSPLYLLGHSLGGQLSALYASVTPDTLHGLILVAACSVWYRGWSFPRNIGVLFMTQSIRGIARVLGYFPGRRLGFGGTESKKMIGDWARQALTGRYDVAHNAHHFESLLKNVTTPVLALSFASDVLAPYRAVDNLCTKMSRAAKIHLHLSAGDLGLRDGQLDHFQWAKNAEPIIGKISQWMCNNSLPPPEAC